MKNKWFSALIWILVLAGASIFIAFKLNKNQEENTAKTALVQVSNPSVAVKTAIAEKGPLSLNYEANGHFLPNKQLDFSAEVAGRITQLMADLGSSVQQGQLLVKIDNEIVNTDLDQNETTLKKLENDLTRYEQAFKNGGITEQQLIDLRLQVTTAKSNLEKAGRKVKDSYMRAPINGIISEKYIEQGAYLAAGTKMFQIVDINALKLRINVPEYQVIKLKKGDKVPVTIDVFPGKELMGTISFISPIGDAALNFPVELELKNFDHNSIKAGMYGRAYFSFVEKADVLLIPRTAFVGSVNSNTIYTLDGETARLKKVKAGRILGEHVEVLEGLDAGTTVITSGQINLLDGSKVTIQK